MSALAATGMFKTGLMDSWRSYCVSLATSTLKCSCLRTDHFRRWTYFHWVYRFWFPFWLDQLFLASAIQTYESQISGSASAFVWACGLCCYGSQPDCSSSWRTFTMGHGVCGNGCGCECAPLFGGSFAVLLLFLILLAAVTAAGLKIFACQIFYGCLRRCGIDPVLDLKIGWVQRLVLCWGCFLDDLLIHHLDFSQHDWAPILALSILSSISSHHILAALQAHYSPTLAAYMISSSSWFHRARGIERRCRGPAGPVLASDQDQ